MDMLREEGGVSGCQGGSLKREKGKQTPNSKILLAVKIKSLLCSLRFHLLQIMKLRLREVEWLAQDHTADEV